MKKQTFIVLLIIILAALSAYFGFIRKSSSELTEFDLQLQDTTHINGFTVESQNIKVAVEKKANGWMVNKSYHANYQLVKRLFRIYKNLNISIFARKDSVEVFVQDLKSNGTKLQFFEDDRSIANYWIGNYDVEKNATLLMNDKEQPIYVTAPGLSANIAKFVIADDIFWRDKRIYDFESEDIVKIQLNDFRNPDASFEIKIDGENYLLFNNRKTKIEFEEENIARYLSYFKGVRFESLEEKFLADKLDSVIQQKPLYEIILETRENENIKLKLIPKADSLNKEQTDLNYVYGLLNDEKPLTIISYFAIDPLLKEITYFKPETNK